MIGRASLALLLSLACAAGCDRRVEPFDPDEEPSTPDLSRIFPPEPLEDEPGTAPMAPPAPPGGRGAPPVAAGAPPVRGTIRLAPELADTLPGGAVLFVFARAAQGGPPLAARLIEAPRFPLDFELGPDDRMMAARPFEGPFLLSARLDADGNATTRSPGDLQGTLETPVTPGDDGVELILDQRL